MPKRKSPPSPAPSSSRKRHKVSPSNRKEDSSTQKSLNGDSQTRTTRCSCKKTACLKSYCECFKNGLTCSSLCNCLNCKNYEGSSPLRDIRKKRNQPKRNTGNGRRKKSSKRNLASVIDSVSASQKMQIKRLKDFVENQTGSFSQSLVEESHREEVAFRRTCAQFMQSPVTPPSTTERDGKGNANASHHETTHTPSPAQHELSLFCDETDAVQAVTRPTVGHSRSLGAAQDSAGALCNGTHTNNNHHSHFDHEHEMKSALEKKVLISFKKHLNRMVADALNKR